MSEQEEHDEFFDPAPPTENFQPNDPARKTGRRILAVVLAVILLAIGFLAGWLVRYYTIDGEVRAFLWAMNITEKFYYQEIEKDAVYANAEGSDGESLMRSLESQLDIYSGFYTNEEYEALLAEGEGQNVGIGISVMDRSVNGRDVPFIILLVENSPAQKAGLDQGMYIFAYGTSESDMQSGNADALTDFILAQKDTFYFRIGYETDGSDARVVSLKRENYQAAFCVYRDSETSYAFRGSSYELSLEETYSPIEGLDDKTAYIRLIEFSGNAAEEFVTCLALMNDRGRSDLILDLRTNGGGYLNILQSISSHLMRNATTSNPVVATANYRSGRVASYRTMDYSNDFYNYFSEDSRVVLLADEFTASASECLIGVLVDYGTLSYDDIYLRASETEDGTVFGKSYGKGIMQSFYPGTLGVMKLTVATVHWPVSGNCIHGVGVTTDDGAHGILADLFRGKEDTMLNEVVAEVCGTGGSAGGSESVSL